MHLKRKDIKCNLEVKIQTATGKRRYEMLLRSKNFNCCWGEIANAAEEERCKCDREKYTKCYFERKMKIETEREIHSMQIKKYLKHNCEGRKQIVKKKEKRKYKLGRIGAKHSWQSNIHTNNATKKERCKCSWEGNTRSDISVQIQVLHGRKET